MEIIFETIIILILRYPGAGLRWLFSRLWNSDKNFKEFLAANHSIKAPKVSLKDNPPIEKIIEEIVNGFEINMTKLSADLNTSNIEPWLKQEKNRLEGLITSGDWKNEFQGKIIFARLCGEVLKADSIRIRECYIDIALDKNPTILNDIVQIFRKM